MAWTLAELSKIETDVLRKSVMDTLLYEANMLEMVPWETIGTLATTVVRYQNLPSVGFRKVNNPYSESTGTFEQKTENISLCGADIDTDKAIARAKNTIGDARAIQQGMMLKALGYSINDKFINGNPVSNPEEYMGIARRIKRNYDAGFTGQVIASATTNQLPHTTDSDVFLDELDKLIYAISAHTPDALLMSSKMLLVIRSVLRRQKLLMTTQDMFGRIIDMYGSVKLIAMGVKADQTTEIIPSDGTEFWSDEVKHSSIYAVKFGIGDQLWGIQEYPLEVKDLGEQQSKPVYRTRLDWPVGLADVDPRCMAVLHNLQIVA
ncbi:hypothetical protein ES707_01297 [subsurface metagenome]